VDTAGVMRSLPQSHLADTIKEKNPYAAGQAFPSCYPLSPNSASLRGFRTLLLHRKRLSELVEKNKETIDKSAFRKTPMFDALNKRFRSMFVWPAFLATFMPRQAGEEDAKIIDNITTPSKLPQFNLHKRMTLPGKRLPMSPLHSSPSKTNLDNSPIQPAPVIQSPNFTNSPRHALSGAKAPSFAQLNPMVFHPRFPHPQFPHPPIAQRFLVPMVSLHPGLPVPMGVPTMMNCQGQLVPVIQRSPVPINLSTPNAPLLPINLPTPYASPLQTQPRMDAPRKRSSSKNNNTQTSSSTQPSTKRRKRTTTKENDNAGKSITAPQHPKQRKVWSQRSPDTLGTTSTTRSHLVDNHTKQLIDNRLSNLISDYLNEGKRQLTPQQSTVATSLNQNVFLPQTLNNQPSGIKRTMLDNSVIALDNSSTDGGGEVAKKKAKN